MKKLFMTVVAVLTLAGALQAKEISAYLVGDYQSKDTVKNTLNSSGFEVLAEYPAVKNGTTLVFTCKGIKKEAAKPGRAFAAVLRVFVDDQNKMISFTNPRYFGRAFMQDDYNDAVFSKAKSKIESAFGGLKGSKDKLEEDKIAGYHFMMGMPYYEDKEVVAEGKNLASKAKNVVFRLDLSNGVSLLGIDLSDKSFIEKIGRANATVLPYCVAIDGDKAEMLHAKYYLAIAYPTLSMGDFMKISSVPGDIEDEMENAFK